MWVLTKDYKLLNTDTSIIDVHDIRRKTDNIYRLISVFDFVYTRSDIKEDFGFVCEIGKDYFDVTFSKMNRKVRFRFENDKKLRLIKEIWKPVDDKTYKKIWSSE